MVGKFADQIHTQLLSEIEHALTEVDLELQEWQTAVDFMSFIGQSVPLKLWVDDREVEDATMTTFAGDTFAFVEGKWEPSEELSAPDISVPLVRYDKGKRIQVGLAHVNDGTGKISAVISREHAGLYEINSHAYSILPDPDGFSFFTEPKEAVRNTLPLSKRIGQIIRKHHNASPNSPEPIFHTNGQWNNDGSFTPDVDNKEH